MNGEAVSQRLWATACHEAGHAVVGDALGQTLRFVTIEPKGHVLGETSWYGRVPTPLSTSYWTERRRIEARILSLYSGVFAEKEITGRRHNWTGAAADNERIGQLALWLESDLASVYLRWARQKARKIVNTHILEVEAVAHSLMNHRTLNRQGLREATRSAPHYGGDRHATWRVRGAEN